MKNVSTPLPENGRRTRRPGRGVAGVALAVSALLVLLAAPSQATYVNAGEGRHGGAIDWLEWGADAAPIVDGSVSTSTRVLNGQSLTISCTVNGVEGKAEAYRSGRWQGDALPGLYSQGSVRANTLVAGIANTIDGTTVRFSVNCAAEYSGAAVPINGLVISDAESNNAAQGEYVRARPNNPSTWRLLDRARNEGCTTATRSSLTSDGTITLDSNGPECTYQRSSWRGPVATAFMEGATGASFELKGGGRSAVAIGVVLASDFGDAPESYGDAGAFMHQSWEGGIIPVGVSNLFDDVAFAVPAAGDVGLGTVIDAEERPAYSDDALGDDLHGAQDEDLIIPARIDAHPGETFTLPPIMCGTGAQVAGWIDWNRNGSFDDGERSSVASCATGSATLSWQVPDAGVGRMVEGASFVRIRSASDASQLSSPVGMTNDGEVEDHAVTLFSPSPELQLTKTAIPESGSAVMAEDVISYTVTAENTGNEPLDPTSVTDDLSEVLQHTSYNDDAAASHGDAPELNESTLVWTGRLEPGERVTLSYSVTVNKSETPVELVNVAQATGYPPTGEAVKTPRASTVHDLTVPESVVPSPFGVGAKGIPGPKIVPSPTPTAPTPTPAAKQPVAAPSERLATTGADQPVLAIAALVLLAAGLAVFGRRKLSHGGKE